MELVRFQQPGGLVRHFRELVRRPVRVHCAGTMPKFAGCVQGSRWFKERGRWQERDYTSNPGAIIFFDWNDPGGFSGPQDGVPDHVGIVEKVEDGRVHTVEGNSGDRCCQRGYPVGHYEIWWYGCPLYNYASDS